MSGRVIGFQGSTQFRARLISSLLSGKKIRIAGIRENEQKPGLKDFEVAYLKLIDELTDGTVITINTTGTQVIFSPGQIIGGEFSFDCNEKQNISSIPHNTSSMSTQPQIRSIMYFIEGVLPFCMFARKNVEVTFKGFTDDDFDQSVEIFNEATIKLLERFDIENTPSVTLKQRSYFNVSMHGSHPLKSPGTVLFQCPIVRELKSINFTDPGFVKRIRGLAFSLRVSPQFSNRMVDSSRAIFNNLLPDVYINTDVNVGSKTRELTHPCYGLNLFAATTNEVIYSSKRVSFIDQANGVASPEEIGDLAAKQLLEEVAAGGCVDSSQQSLALLLMALCRDVSKIRLGQLTTQSIEMLRIINSVFGVKFKIRIEGTSPLKDKDLSVLEEEFDNVEPEDEDSDEEREKEEKRAEISNRYNSTILSCKGIGYQNMSRTVS